MDAQECQNLKDFMENVIYAYKNKVHTSRVFPKLKQTELKYKSDDIVEDIADSDNIKLVILTDTASMSDNLQNMVKRFQANFSKELLVFLTENNTLSMALSLADCMPVMLRSLEILAQSEVRECQRC